MTIKVKTNKSFQSLSKLFSAANTKFSRAMKFEMADIIIREYEKGTSPVKGYNPFVKRKDGSKSRMFDSGDLYESVKVTQQSDGSGVTLSVGKGLKYARYHQDGTGKMKKRPLLPEKSNQRFKKGVLDQIEKAARKAIALAVKKYS